MGYENISKMKHFQNLKQSGLDILEERLHVFFNADIEVCSDDIDVIERELSLGLSDTPNRRCYWINTQRIMVLISILSDKYKILPIFLEGENLADVSNTVFEKLSIVLSKRMTICMENGFRSGTKLFGEEMLKEFMIEVLTDKNYDASRICTIFELIEKLSVMTFEGHPFSTGIIISRSLFDYSKGKQNDRNGKLLKLADEVDLIRNPQVNKRFWYLVDGLNSFYIVDQNMIIQNVFLRDSGDSSVTSYFDSYLLSETLYGGDLAFRVIGPGEVSIINRDGIEFLKMESHWKFRNYEVLRKFIKTKTKLEEKTRNALIYFITMCSKNHVSSIIWVPDDREKIDEYISVKTKQYKSTIKITDDNCESLVLRILSSDGVTIITEDGEIMYIGAIVNINLSNNQGLLGTGESAAKILSENGIAFKISQDGGIKIFDSPNSGPLLF